MVQTLEAIKGGGGSVKIGTTGTISALMSRELNSAKHVSKVQLSTSSSSSCAQTVENAFSQKPKVKTSADAASGSGSSNILKNRTSTETHRKWKRNSGSTHHIPMLTSRDVSIDGTPVRRKNTACMVEIVDIKCGNPDKAWVNPLTSRLKKLGFSKLSESMI